MCAVLNAASRFPGMCNSGGLLHSAPLSSVSLLLSLSSDVGDPTLAGFPFREVGSSSSHVLRFFHSGNSSFCTSEFVYVTSAGCLCVV